MPSALVHIGLHKTGSTYVQMICSGSRAELRDAGVHFIASGLKESVRRTRKQIERGEVTERQALWEPATLRKALAKAPADKHLFLSCESLEYLGRWPRSLADLHALLMERYERVQYFVIVRHVVDHAASELQQSAKAFHARDLFRRMRYLQGRPLQDRLLSFCEGDYPLIVADFDTFVKGDTPAQLAQLLSQTLGIDPPALNDRPASNESIGAMGVAFMLAVTNLTREALGSRIPNLVDWPHFKSVQVHTRDAIRNHLGSETRFMPFTEEEQRDVIRRAREANAPFVERFPGAWTDTVLSERVKPYNVVLLSELAEPERARVVALVLETWSRIERLLRKDFELQDGFDARAALDRYLERERESMLRAEPLYPDFAERKTRRNAQRDARRARRREQKAQRKAAAQAAAPQAGEALPHSGAPRAGGRKRRATESSAPAATPVPRPRAWRPWHSLAGLLRTLARVFGLGKTATPVPQGTATRDRRDT